MYIKAPTAKGNCKYVREFPADCAKQIGKRNFVKTLGTRNVAEANRRQKEIDNLFDLEVYNIRSRALIPKDERQDLVSYLIGCNLLPASATDIDLMLVNKLLAELNLRQKQSIDSDKFAAKFGTINPVSASTAQNRLRIAQARFLEKSDTPNSLDVAKLVYRVKPKASDNTSDVFDKVMNAIEKIYPTSLSGSNKPCAYKLRDVYEAWAKSEKTVRQKYHVGHAYTLLKDWSGNRPINSYTKQDMRDFLAALQSMPIKLPPDVKALSSFKDQHEAVVARKIEGKTRAGQTIQNLKDALSSLFELAINELDVEMLNPIKKISIDVKKDKKKRVRHEEEDLCSIFYSPLYKGFESQRFRHRAGNKICKDAKFWLPLIGLFCGARQEEMAQVHLTDVYEKKGVTYFHINDWSPTKKVKTEGSIRTVPVHQELIRIGFLDYVNDMIKKGERLLFPELNLSPDGRYAKEFSKWYGRFARKIGIVVQTEHTRKDFHSFRHTFITAARKAKIDAQYIIQIVGHGEGDFGNVSVVHQSYGIYEPQTLNEELQKLRYDDLDLSFLHNKSQAIPMMCNLETKADQTTNSNMIDAGVFKLKPS